MKLKKNADQKKIIKIYKSKFVFFCVECEKSRIKSNKKVRAKKGKS